MGGELACTWRTPMLVFYLQFKMFIFLYVIDLRKWLRKWFHDVHSSSDLTKLLFLKIINTFDFVQRCPLCVTFSAYVPCLILEAPDFLFLNLLRCSSVKTKMWSRWLWLRWSITLCVTYLLKFYFEVKHSERVTQRNKKRRKKVFINCLNIYIWNGANWNYTWPYITRHSYRTGLRWNKERPPYRRWPPKLPQFF